MGLIFLSLVIACCVVQEHVGVLLAARIRRGESSPSLQKVNTTERLKDLRALMQKEGISAYIIPSVDQHMSEYVAPPFQRREYISGFTGSRGVPGFPTIAQWLAQELINRQRVGVDGRLISIADFEDMKKKLSPSLVSLMSVSKNLVDEIWKEGRPSLSNATIFPLEMKFTGKSWRDKVKDMRAEMSSNSATCVVVYKLDEVAWLLNLRGADVPSNPFFFGFVLVTSSEVRVYVHSEKLNDAAKTHLGDASVLEYNMSNFIEDIGSESRKSNAMIWLSPYASYAMKEAIQSLKDSTAMVEFFFWLKNEVPKKSKDLTEMSSVAKLEEFKSKQEFYKGYSFNTIAGFGPNGAIIHYRPEPSTNLQITDESTFLVDSGSQFLDGTTDATRTVHFGTPTKKQKDAYTRVLKGQIDLALTVFPNSTQGRFLDPIARKELWRNGLDYRHGTGHGIGMFLSVHEGPQRIASGCPKPWEKPVVPGMFQSDEPGYYEDHKFGIRLETVVLAVAAKTENTFNDVEYVTFEPVTFIDWLNKYHKDCREKVGKMLKDQRKNDVYNWLVEITEPVGKTDAIAGSLSLAASVFTFLWVALGLICVM
ncbi:putative Xaa-Pro aminopeptidase P [Acropora cervicornis]|uniref:Xaa-Pro aminopeptidase P n=1 Tax=Acropora cervicornis TaxID=6130 RepID=A0AAD9Q8T5_ACRCE|nr:putative Xaa-Pro aminopeptidase P [Acropora cervicornis]